MRVVVGIALASHAVQRLETGPAIKSTTVQVFAVAVGLSLFAGFWTPLAGLLVVILEIRDALAERGDPWVQILLATIGIALVFIGPGAFSLDARRFGWKRIDIQDRNTPISPTDHDNSSQD